MIKVVTIPVGNASLALPFSFSHLEKSCMTSSIYAYIIVCDSSMKVPCHKVQQFSGQQLNFKEDAGITRRWKYWLLTSDDIPCYLAFFFGFLM